MTSISIIIVEHHRQDLLSKCLESIRNQTYPPVSVTVGHNGLDKSSSNTTFRYGASSLVYPERNGFAATANNLAAKAANDGDLVLLLANDITLEEPAREGIDIQSVIQGPVMLEGNRYVGGAGNWHRLFLYPIIPKIGRHISRHVDAVGGGCMALPAWFIRTHGLFDASLWSYAEDLDLSFRAAKLGCRCYSNANCVCHHTPDNAFSRQLALRYYYGVRNLIRVVRRHRWGCYPFNIAAFIPVLLACNLRRRGSLKPSWKGYWHGIFHSPLSHDSATAGLLERMKEPHPTKKEPTI